MAFEKPLPEHLKKSLAGSKAQYVRLGNSGLRVSVPIFGAMSIGDRRTLPWCVEEEQVSFPLQLHLTITLSLSIAYV